MPCLRGILYNYIRLTTETLNYFIHLKFSANMRFISMSSAYALVRIGKMKFDDVLFVI
jgi:uncharacterized pyridoxamine 5'-phosphate oxidase family protein